MSQLELRFDRSSERGNRACDIYVKEFNGLFCQAIEDCLNELFGANVLATIYDAVEKHYDVKRDEVPYRPDTMHSVLKFVFGVKGTQMIERRIFRQFYHKVGLALS